MTSSMVMPKCLPYALVIGDSGRGGSALLWPPSVQDLWFLSCVGGVLDNAQEVITDSGDGRQRPGRIVVNGPLAGFSDGLRRELAGQG